MFSRLAKFRKSDDYEDLEGVDRVEMDITEPTMREFAAMDNPEPVMTKAVPRDEPPEGIELLFLQNKSIQ